MRRSFNELHTELLATRDWLASLGVPVTDNRFSHLFAVAEKASTALARCRQTREPVAIGHISTFLQGMVEAQDFVSIHEAFEHDRSAGLIRKLQLAVGGSATPDEEDSGPGSVARNTTFELSLAADLARSEARITLGEPDIIVYHQGNNYVLECKRPYEATGIPRNIVESAKQLTELLPTIEESAGVITISIQRMIDADFGVFRTEQDALTKLDEVTTSMLQTQDKFCQKAVTGDNIVAVAFHAATACNVAGALMRVSHISILNVGKPDHRVSLIGKLLSSIYVLQN